MLGCQEVPIVPRMHAALYARVHRTHFRNRTHGTHYASWVDSVRLDIWLDVACVFKTRSEAQKACRLGKISVNGATAKANRDLRIGDELVVQRPLGRKQLLIVLGLADTHVSRADARLLYQDTTPKPTPEEIEQRKLERIYRAVSVPSARPGRDERRARRRMKQGE